MKALRQAILLFGVLGGYVEHTANGQGLVPVKTYLEDPSEVPNAGLFIHNDLAYVGGHSNGYNTINQVGVRIVDLSNPEAPELLSRIPLRRAHRLHGYSYGGAVVTDLDTDHFNGTIAVVTSGVPDRYTIWDWVEPFGVWDVSDPANPEFLSIFGEGEYPHIGLGDLGDYPKLGTAIAGTHFFYLYQPVYRDAGSRNDLDVHLGIVDLSDPYNPKQIASWQDSHRVGMVGLSVNKAGTRAYVSALWPKPLGQLATRGRLYILDVSNPADPREIGRWEMFLRNTPMGISSAFMARATDDDQIVIFADGGWGDDDEDKHGILHILDTSDPSDITKLSEFDIYKINPRDGWHMAVNLSIRGSTVYSAWLDGGVVAVDITDPSRPEMTGQFISKWIADAFPLGDRYVVASPVWEGGIVVLMDESTGSKATRSETKGDLPERFVLHQNYPNPFNPSTAISFELPEAAHVLLSVFDLTGREVRRLVDKTMPAGSHRAHFDAGNLPGGVYLYRVSAGSWSETRKAVLLK
ncbi:MAG TPA: T9SS type A sorting domain-containing protein [Rhodothermales bacterium]|nr:T9SS type A sorting domain-containing protein [Rhodothermales bacterium]